MLAVLPAAAPQAAAAAVAAGAAESGMAAKGAGAASLAGAVAGPLLGVAGAYLDPRALSPQNLAAKPPSAVYASFAGGVFGSLCWMPIMAFIARDYTYALATIAFAILLYAVSVRAALAAPRAFFRVSMAEASAAFAWTALVVNRRWEPWLEAYRRTSIYEPMADLPLWAMNLLLVAVYLWVLLRLLSLERQHQRG